MVTLITSPVARFKSATKTGVIFALISIISFKGINFLGDLGWAFSNRTEQGLFAFTPFIGYGYNWINFSRSNFTILGIVTQLGEVDENYDVHYIEGGAKINWDITDKLLADLRGSYGIVFYNRADNDLLGSMEGDGGYIPKVELKIKYLAKSV